MSVSGELERYLRTVHCDGPATDLGFGLYLPKALVSRYGGRIWVEECPELGGAAFSVQLRRDFHHALSVRRKPKANAL